MKMSNVIHPGHYNIPGRKECIEEMLDKFGYGKTEAFCELNSYKYQYRHEQKNGQFCHFFNQLQTTMDWKFRCSS